MSGMTQQQRPAGGGYRFGAARQITAESRERSLILVPGCNAETWRPSWDGTVTIFRPLPAWESGVPLPYRNSENDQDFTDWIRTYRCAMRVGDPSIDIILYDPFDPQLDKAACPYEMIMSHLFQLEKANQMPQPWFEMRQYQAGKGRKIDWSTPAYFTQGILIAHKNLFLNPARGSAENDKSVVMIYSKQPGEELTTACDVRHEAQPQISQQRAQEDPWSQTFTHGDITHLRHGSFIITRQKGAAAGGAAPQVAIGGRRQQGPRGGGGRGQDDGPKGYDVHVVPRLENNATADVSALAPLWAQKWQPWDNILNIPSYGDQVALLSRCLPADMIVKILGNRYREYIPVEVMRMYEQRSHQQPAGLAGQAPLSTTFVGQGQQHGGGYAGPQGGVSYGPQGGGGYNQGQNGYGQGQNGHVQGQVGYDPNAYDPNQGTYDPNQVAYDPNQGTYDPNAQGQIVGGGGVVDMGAPEGQDGDYGWDPNAQVAPVHNAPVHNAPVHNAPVHNAPVHNAPVHNAPVGGLSFGAPPPQTGMMTPTGGVRGNAGGAPMGGAPMGGAPRGGPVGQPGAPGQQFHTPTQQEQDSTSDAIARARRAAQANNRRPAGAPAAGPAVGPQATAPAVMPGAGGQGQLPY